MADPVGRSIDRDGRATLMVVALVRPGAVEGRDGEADQQGFSRCGTVDRSSERFVGFLACVGEVTDRLARIAGQTAGESAGEHEVLAVVGCTSRTGRDGNPGGYGCSG